MAAVPPEHLGIAFGITNAVSRVAGLLAVAVLGLVWNGVFDHSLNRCLQALHLPSEVRARIEADRSKLAAAAPATPGRRAIQDPFVSGFRTVAWIAASLD